MPDLDAALEASIVQKRQEDQSLALSSLPLVLGHELCHWVHQNFDGGQNDQKRIIKIELIEAYFESMERFVRRRTNMHGHAYMSLSLPPPIFFLRHGIRIFCTYCTDMRMIWEISSIEFQS